MKIDVRTIKSFKTKFGTICYLKNDIPFVTQFLEDNKVYEEDLVFKYFKNILKQSKIVLDIGSHVGGHIFMFKHINPSLEIYAFEPQKKIFEVLLHNIESNDFENIKLYNNAVANKTIKTTLSDLVINPEETILVDYKNPGYNNFGGVQLGENGEEVQTITIDSLNLQGCDFMKIDVEGAEHLVLLGAQETIKKYQPYIWFEKNFKKLNNETNFKFEGNNIDSIELIENLGYKNMILQIDQDNYLAVPKSKNIFGDLK